MPPIPFRGNPMGLSIPGGYTRVSYLANTGTQSILTDIYLDDCLSDGVAYKFAVDCSIETRGGSYYDYAFVFQPIASRARYGVAAMAGWVTSTQCALYDPGANMSRNFNAFVPCTTQKRYLFELTIQKGKLSDLYIDGVVVTPERTEYVSAEGITATPQPIRLFSPSGPKWKMYGATVIRNGVRVYDFIPCLDGAGRPCMFENVTKRTYYNTGTGEFQWG